LYISVLKDTDIIFGNNFGLYIIFELNELFQISNQIWFFQFFSYLFQLFDITVFNIYKYYYSLKIEYTTAIEFSKFIKINFVTYLKSICTEISKLSTIKFGFILTGIWLFKPEIVYNCLAEYNNIQPRLFLSGPNNSEFPIIPITVSRLKKLEKYILKYFSVTDKFIKLISENIQIYMYQFAQVYKKLENTINIYKIHNIYNSIFLFGYYYIWYY